MTLNGTTGVISGTSMASGTFSFTVTTKDAISFTATQAYLFTIAAPTITLMPASGTLNATAETAYSQKVSASGGTSPYTYSISAGALPAGLTLNGTTGVISGTPTMSGTFSFTVMAKDANSFTTTHAYLFTIAGPTITLMPATLPTPTVGVAYSQTISSTGGTSPYTYSISAGTLPAGLTLNGTTGVISGTATAAGTFSFTVTAKDSNSFSATRSYSSMVAEQASQTAVNASPLAASPVQTVTLIATVSPTFAGTSNVPSRTVTFLDSRTEVGTAPLSGGMAKLVAQGVCPPAPPRRSQPLTLAMATFSPAPQATARRW